MNERQLKIAALCDGSRSSKQIAQLLGDNPKYVQRTMLAFGLPCLPRGAQKGDANPFWSCGRSIDLDGYADVPCPDGFAPRNNGRIAEHRLVACQMLGRDLRPLEVVDHIDGLTLHNCPSNLRIFETNADHLRATIGGGRLSRMMLPPRQRKESPRVDTHRLRKACGDVRTLQILLAALRLGIDSPFLLGSSLHLEKAGISDFSSTNLARALADLYRKYA